MPNALIDIGINLTHDSYDADRAQVMERAAAAGIVQMLVTGASLDGSRAALDLATTHPGRLFATAGCHPHHAIDHDAAKLRQLAELATQPSVVAVGECGLDYFRDYSPRPRQREVFAAQLAVAGRLQKPVFLHQRDAHTDFLGIVREQRAALNGGVVHCFTDNERALRDYLDLDLYIGMTGWICDERRGRDLLKLLPLIPTDRLLVETDGPYLLPRDVQPKPASRRNEPMYLPHIVAAIAAARGESVAALAENTTANARRLFNILDC